MPMTKSLPPGSTIGIIGGGQLGRMAALAAARLGYRVHVFCPEADSPTEQVAAVATVAEYTDLAALEAFARAVDVVTFEFENIPAESVRVLSALVPVRPGWRVLEVAQDRIAEKSFFNSIGIGTAPWAAVNSAEVLKQAVATLGRRAVLKTTRFGYDGKGQVRVKTLEELAKAWDELGRVACVLEKMLPLAHECSVIVARGRDGSIVNLPVQRNLHRDGILAVTEVYEENLPAAQVEQALAAAKSVAEGLNYVGVLCVEFFVLQDGSLVVNEIAPRPHNSGHYSQNGCDVSQFELQVRCMTGLPLVQPRLHSPSIMLNLLGDLWFKDSDTAQTPAWDQVLALPGCHLHLYGKVDAKRARKMGHLNITGSTPEQVRATALKAAEILGIAPF